MLQHVCNSVYLVIRIRAVLQPVPDCVLRFGCLRYVFKHWVGDGNLIVHDDLAGPALSKPVPTAIAVGQLRHHYPDNEAESQDRKRE
jgi:hypothetical protein